MLLNTTNRSISEVIRPQSVPAQNLARFFRFLDQSPGSARFESWKCSFFSRTNVGWETWTVDLWTSVSTFLYLTAQEFRFPSAPSVRFQSTDNSNRIRPDSIKVWRKNYQNALKALSDDCERNMVRWLRFVSRAQGTISEILNPKCILGLIS